MSNATIPLSDQNVRRSVNSPAVACLPRVATGSAASKRRHDEPVVTLLRMTPHGMSIRLSNGARTDGSGPEGPSFNCSTLSRALIQDVIAQTITSRRQLCSSIAIGWIEAVGDGRYYCQIARKFYFLVAWLHQDRAVHAEPPHEQSELKNHVVAQLVARKTPSFQGMTSKSS